MFRELNSDWRLGAKPDLLSTSCRFGWCELFMGSISADIHFYGMSDFNYRNSKMLHLNIQSLKLEFGLFLSRHFGKLLPIVFSHCCAINVPCSLFFLLFSDEYLYFFLQ